MGEYVAPRRITSEAAAVLGLATPYDSLTDSKPETIGLAVALNKRESGANRLGVRQRSCARDRSVPVVGDSRCPRSFRSVGDSRWGRGVNGGSKASTTLNIVKRPSRSTTTLRPSEGLAGEPNDEGSRRFRGLDRLGNFRVGWVRAKTGKGRKADPHGTTWLLQRCRPADRNGSPWATEPVAVDRRQMTRTAAP
jgi:hypothetical protein